MGYSEAVADFMGTMELEGIRPVEPIAQRLAASELIRFACDGDGKGRQNGWAILYLDERPAGAFGNYRLGVSRKWRAGDDHCLSPDERARLQAEWRDAKERRARERDASMHEAALDAGDMWASAGPFSPDHAYLARKSMQVPVLRQLGGNLLVPMVDAEGQIRNLQRIGADGKKRFLKGGRTEGLFFTIGRFTRCGETVCLGEGLATMAAVHAASGYPCIVAFSAKNLGAVARLWRDARPDLDFVICADDDGHLAVNVGMEAAKAAAAEIGARIAVPMAHAA
jgi:putative DNA primase/helicase